MTDQPRDLAAEAAEISRIHDEGRYDQYGEHPAESIGTLLDYIAALSRELEEATQAGIDTAREISDTLTGRIDELEAESERLQSQLTAQRRPVVHDDICEDARRMWQIEIDEVCQAGVRPTAATLHLFHMDGLLKALDSAQREIQDLRLQGALRKYANHHDDCDSRETFVYAGGKCDCGLDETLAASQHTAGSACEHRETHPGMLADQPCHYCDGTATVDSSGDGVAGD